jgi:signal transduction histidine kinase
MRWIGGTVFPVITPDGVLREVVVVHHDITELKQAEATLRDLNLILEARVTERTTALRASEEELRKALIAERELSQLKTSFVGMVSHEFRTPLGIIQAAADLLQRHHDKLNPEQRQQQTDVILKAVRRMAAMMEDILLLGRMDSAHGAAKPVHMDVATWMEAHLDSWCPNPADRERVALEANETVYASLDESLLHHIMGNLVSNACKYSPDNRPVLIQVTTVGDDVRLSVSDQGIGMAVSEQARLFEGFFRASNVGNRPGSGLGLTIAQRCVHRMGGRLEVTSELGVGSTFAVVLPKNREAAP